MRLGLSIRTLFDSPRKVTSRAFVGETHLAALEAAGEEDALGALDEVGEAVAGAFDDGVVGVARVADPGGGGGVPA